MKHIMFPRNRLSIASGASPAGYGMLKACFFRDRSGETIRAGAQRVRG